MKTKQIVARLYQLVSHQRFEEARNLSLNLTQSHLENVVFWRMRGDLHLKLEEFEAAIECIHRVISLSSPLNRDSFIELHHVLGTTYYKVGRIHDAIETLDKIISVNPDHADARTFRFMCYSLLGDFERSWPDYEYRRRLKFFTAEALRVPT